MVLADDDDGKIMNCKSLVMNSVSYYYYVSVCLQSLAFVSASLGFVGEHEDRELFLIACECINIIISSVASVTGCKYHHEFCCNL